MLGSSQPPGLLLLQERPHDHGHGRAIERFQFFHFLATFVSSFDREKSTTLHRYLSRSRIAPSAILFPRRLTIMRGWRGGGAPTPAPWRGKRFAFPLPTVASFPASPSRTSSCDQGGIPPWSPRPAKAGRAAWHNRRHLRILIIVFIPL